MDSQIKATWNIIKHNTRKLHLAEQIPSLLTKSKKVKDPERVVNALITLFLIITENLKLHLMRGKRD